MGKFSNPRTPKASAPGPVKKTTAATKASASAKPDAPKKPEPQAPSPEPTSVSSVGKNRKIMLISICSVAAVMLIGAISVVWYLFGRDPNDGKILNNVMVAGINLGGMTPEEATAALHRATDNTYTVENMVIELPDTILEFSPSDTGAKLNVEAVVEEAFSYGRRGSLEERRNALESSMTTDHPIALLPYLGLNLEYIRGQLDNYGQGFNSTYAPSSAVVKGEIPVLDASKEGFDLNNPCQTLVVNLGMPGRYVDINQVYNRVLDAYSFNTFLVQVKMQEAEKLPEEIDLEALYAEYVSNPVNAFLDPETYDVVPEVYGYHFNLENALEQMEQTSYGGSFEIPFEYIHPELDGETLKSMLFRDVLGYCETEHTKDENRNTNLRLACEAINGTILYPGEVFDYNTVVGKRTAEKGYKPAAAYSSGKTVQSLGGGVCQVSSTIYYCTLIADLEIVNRLPHSYVSSYMPMGMDATVSWGGPEFTFKNSTNYPIRIDATVADGYVKVTLMGTDEKDYYIQMEYEIIGVEYPTTVQEEYAPGNSEGYRDGQVIQTAYTGYTVNTYKCKYDKQTNELISRDFDRLSKYKKRDKIVAVVVAPTEPPTSETPAPETPAPENPAPENPAPQDTSGSENPTP